MRRDRKKRQNLKGKRVKVTVYDDEDVFGPNKEALRVIREVEKKQENMRETPSEETQKILREGRN